MPYPRDVPAKNREDLAGQKFGLLTVISYADTVGRRARWHCQCECGVQKIVPGKELRNGHSKSCGCRARAYKHGLHKNRFYYVYSGMMKRCYNEKHEAYARYGGRGIIVCDEWRTDISKFIAWCESKSPDPDFTLDRKENNGNYTPDNCQFVARVDQQKNMRSNVIVDYEGEKMIYKDFVKKYGCVSYSTAVARSKNGWDRITAALTGKKR